MKYNFNKLLDIPKYQDGTTGEGIKPLINLTDPTRTNRYKNKLGWSGANPQWLNENGQYDFEKMYQDYLQNKGSFDLTVITATPDQENATVNKKGYLDWNRQYNSSGLNKYFGYSDQQADYYGPTTSARKAFLDYLTQRENGTIADSDVQKTTLPEQPEAEQPEEEVEETPTQEYPIPELSRDHTPWTDWLPLTFQLGNDLMSAERQAALRKKMRFPLIEGPFFQHKVTNDYHLRTGMQQNANELRDLGAFRSNSSDLRANLDNMHKYDVQASEIENQAEQHKADTTFKERQIAEAVEKEDKQIGAEVANYNTKANAAAWNNILDANMRRDLARTAALNSYIGNMYTSHGEWLKDARLNDLQYAQGINEYMASVDAKKAYDKYNGLSEFKSKAYNDFKNWFNTDQARSIDGFDINTWEAAKANGTTEQYIQNLWRTSKAAQSYRDAWAKEQTDAEQQLINRLQLIKMRRGVADLYLPATVNNQGFYDSEKYAPTYQSIFSHKRGGSVRARAIDYWEHIRKENQSTKRSQEKRNSDINKKLSQDLDRLTKEQLILLRSIFK